MSARTDLWARDNTTPEGTPDIAATAEYMEKFEKTSFIDMDVVMKCCPVGMDMEPNIEKEWQEEKGLVWTNKSNSSDSKVTENTLYQA